MPVAGQLTKDRFGYSLPIDSPLYAPFPIYYEGVRILLFPYLTDAAAAAALLPAQFELVTVDPAGSLAVAQVVFATYPFSNIGAYNEVAQTLMVTYKGEPGAYAVRLHVTNDQAMAAGREIGGFPKKLGNISFTEGATCLSTLTTMDGLPLCSGEVDPLQPVQGGPEMARPATFYSLRVIPNPADPAQPSVCQLIQTVWDLYDGTLWSGRGQLHFTGASALNPYHTLPIVKLLDPLKTQPKTPADAFGVGVFRGKMKIDTVTVLEDF